MSSSLSFLPALSALVGRDLAKSYGDRLVLDGVELVAAPGRPLGLVGENGVGKSTLLRLLAGDETPDAGSVERPADLVHLTQEPDFPEGATVGDVLDEALAPLHRAVARLEELAGRLDQPGVAEEYDATLTWAGLHDAWEADTRADRAAARLGLGRLDRSRPAAALSGGQRSRLALAALVTRRPTCVLLDEPTNHLDDQAVSLLEEFVTSLPGVAVVASHDRAFLDAVCGAIVDLDPGGQRVHRRLHRVPRREAGRPSPLAGGLRGPAGRARRAAPGRRHDRARRGAAQPAAAGRRQVHPPLQGAERRPRRQPPGEGRRAPHRGAGA